MADPAIVAEGLGKRFGQVTAIDGVDLELPAGGVLGVLGPNGAGKTTMVRILATLLRPDRGRAWVAGFDVVSNPASVRRRIGLSGQYAAVDPFLTGQENLVMIGRLYGLTRRQTRCRAGELIDILELAGAAGRLVRTYSGGMRRRLDVAASLLVAPPVLFLDEPTTGLDPRGRLALWQVLSELISGGTSLLLTTQYIEEAERLAGRIVIIDHGKVIASGTPGQLRARAGGDRLDLQPLPGQDLRRLADALAVLATADPVLDEAAGRVIVPVAGGSGILPEAASRVATGMVDRFRSLPITAAAVLAGRVAADALRNLFVAGLMISVGAAIGFRFHAGPAAALAAVALAVVTGLAFSWLNLLLGLAVRDPESAGLAGLLAVTVPAAVASYRHATST